MSRGRWSIGIASASALVLFVLGWVNRRRTVAPLDLSCTELIHVDDDYPSCWPLSSVDSVLMHPEDTIRYALDTPIGILQWRALVPPAAPNSTVYLGQNARPFTVAMFHQLQCLDIIRAALISEADDTKEAVLANHCMNYLRQTTLCHGHVALESVRSDQRPKITDLTRSSYVCRDWRTIYRAVEYQRHS